MTVYLTKLADDETRVEVSTYAEIVGGVYAHRWVSDPDDYPAGGDRMSGTDLVSTCDRARMFGIDPEAPRYVQIPCAALDGIHDDLLGRSNYERLLEDFPEHVIEATWTYSDCLLVRVGSVIPTLLADAIAGLEDYPLYDEEDYSRREWEAFEATVREALEFAAREYDDDTEDAQLAVGLAYCQDGDVCRAEEVDWDVLADLLRDHLSAHAEG